MKTKPSYKRNGLHVPGKRNGYLGHREEMAQERRGSQRMDLKNAGVNLLYLLSTFARSTRVLSSKLHSTFMQTWIYKTFIFVDN